MDMHPQEPMESDLLSLRASVEPMAIDNILSILSGLDSSRLKVCRRLFLHIASLKMLSEKHV